MTTGRRGGAAAGVFATIVHSSVVLRSRQAARVYISFVDFTPYWTTVAQIVPVLFLTVLIEGGRAATKARFLAWLHFGTLAVLAALEIMILARLASPAVREDPGLDKTLALVTSTVITTAFVALGISLWLGRMFKRLDKMGEALKEVEQAAAQIQVANVKLQDYVQQFDQLAARDVDSVSEDHPRAEP